jgi:di/tricarboxylate transporter
MPDVPPRPGRSGWGLWHLLTTSGAMLALLLVAPMLLASGSPPPKPRLVAPGAGRLTSDLDRVVAALRGARPTFVAGQTDRLTVEFSLKDEGVRWHPERRPTLRITVPEESGIRFHGEPQNGDVLVPLKAPASGTKTLVAKLGYDVSSRVRVKNYRIHLQLTAPLVAADGGRLQDSGRVTVPLRVETPLRTKIMVLSVIAIAIFLFVVEWFRVDVVAIMMMVGLPVLNLLDSKRTFNGLSSNAVVAIIGVMMVSAGLNKVGIVSRVVRPVINAAGSSPTKLMVFLSSLIAVISSVMQNTGAAVLFLPGIRHACREMKIPISRVLMPIGMCAILGGTLTMIGTSPLILLNDILPEGVSRFGLLELTPIGLGLVAGGIVYFATFGKFFLTRIARAQQARRGGEQVVEEAHARSFYHELDGPFELEVPAEFAPRGPTSVAEIRLRHNTNIVALADETGSVTLAPAPDAKIKPRFSLCVYGPRENVDAFIEEYGLEELPRPRRFRELHNPAVAGVVEAMVSPRATMIGSTIKEIGFRKTYGVTVLAVYREGKTYYKEMSDIPLVAGDALLLHATWEQFHSLQQAHQNFTIITPLEVEIQKPSKARSAVVCFLIALTLMLVSSFYFQKLPYNPIPLSVCLMMGALAMVVTGVLSIREAYQAVDWRTVFLLGGLIPLGMAVDRTGTAEWIATGVVNALGDSVTPLVLLIVLGAMSGAFCLVISNVGACTLLVPLGASMASQIGIDPRVAAIVVGIGVSNSFLLPTHQVNALYMGPGDYRTKDYMKIGGTLSLIYAAVLVTMTYLFYT